MYGPRGPDKLSRAGQYILLLEIRYLHLLYSLRAKDHCWWSSTLLWALEIAMGDEII